MILQWVGPFRYLNSQEVRFKGTFTLVQILQWTAELPQVDRKFPITVFIQSNMESTDRCILSKWAFRVTPSLSPSNRNGALDCFDINPPKFFNRLSIPFVSVYPTQQSGYHMSLAKMDSAPSSSVVGIHALHSGNLHLHANSEASLLKMSDLPVPSR